MVKNCKKFAMPDKEGKLQSKARKSIIKLQKRTLSDAWCEGCREVHPHKKEGASGYHRRECTSCGVSVVNMPGVNFGFKDKDTKTKT